MIVVTFVNRRWAAPHSPEPAMKRILRAVVHRCRKRFPAYADLCEVKFVAPQDICKWIAEQDDAVTGKEDERHDLNLKCAAL